MKLKNLLSGSGTETVYRADEKFDVVQLERKEVTYSYFADPLYVFMDNEYNQHEVEADNLGDAIHYLEDGLACELTFYEGKAISVELPNSVVREVKYTEPAVKGDTSGKVMKPAKLAQRRRDPGSAVRHHRRPHRDRHAHRRVPPPRLTAAPAQTPPPDGVSALRSLPPVPPPLAPTGPEAAALPHSGSLVARRRRFLAPIVCRNRWSRRMVAVSALPARINSSSMGNFYPLSAAHRLGSVVRRRCEYCLH